MRVCISLRARVRPSIHPPVHPSVLCYFRTTNMAVFDGKKLSNDIQINDTLSGDEVVASDGPRSTCLPSLPHVT